MWLYSIGLFVAFVAGLPFWLLRMAQSGKYRAGLAARFGRVPKHLGGGATRVIWVHAVSVGEVIAILPLAARLAEEHPKYRVLLSITTQAGYQIARQRWGAERVFYFPLDFRWIVQRYLRVLQPIIIVLAETELWPNFLFSAEKAHVPVAVVNARISDRSYPRYRRLRWFWRPRFRRIALYCAQSEQDARRLVHIGAPEERVHVSGNLKFDVPAIRNATFVDQLRLYLGGATVLVAGSTTDGEEDLLLDAYTALSRELPDLVLVLAPRHPDRFPAVAAKLSARAIPFIRRSQWMGGAPAGQRGAVLLLLDSLGELASAYSLATVAFVGGSLMRGGGHNPLEPAQWGVPIVMGESYENFRDIVEKLLAARAICIVRCEDLQKELKALLSNKEAAHAMGKRARILARSQTGALDRTLAALNALLLETAP